MDEGIIKYEEEVLFIKSKLELHNMSLIEISQLWEAFSSELYCAGFLNPDDGLINIFKHWIKGE